MKLSFVETEAVNQALFSFIENLNLHFVRSLTLRLAAGQSSNFDFPSLIRPSRARNTSSCQAGDGTFSGVFRRSSQISSRARSLSSIVILSNGMVTGIELSSRLKI
jgi:hypothetical protein